LASVARAQTLVQLTDELVALLDARAAAEGVSRSRLIRELLEQALSDDRRAARSRRIVAGYAAAPQQDARDAWGDLDEWTDANTRRNRAALAGEEADAW
jgi:metal-responsive CopG/Arc/MetJ family transcriptional regulator